MYADPDSEAIDRATILIRNGRIAQVGSNLPIPAEAQVLPWEGATVVAGFWNAHVHFTEPKWGSLVRGRSVGLNAQLADMLTRRGFTTVVDAGSNPCRTPRIRQRIEQGDALGPRIYTAGSSIFPPKGIPYYLRDSVPFYLRWLAAQPASPAAMDRWIGRNIRWGADLVKLFTGSYVARGHVLPMPEGIAAHGVRTAHAHGQLVYAHASNLEGTRVAIRAGVDVLAHAPDTTEGIDDALLRAIVDRRMAMIPTLKMFASTVGTDSAYLGPIYDLVRRFRSLGGELLFGTDVGYMTDYATEGEFQALEECGLSWREVLRMLTTGPAGHFGATAEGGTIAVGKRADLVALSEDPVKELGAFARVRSTVRGGRVLWDDS